MLLLLAAGVLPTSSMAANLEPPEATNGVAVAALLGATECSPTAISELSSAAERAQATWAEKLTTAAYDNFRAARNLWNDRLNECSLAVDSATPGIAPVTGANLLQPQSAAGTPVYVPDAGIAVDIRSASNEVIAGLNVVYTVVVTTGSSDTATSTNVEVSVTLPVAADGPQYIDDTAGCIFATPTLTCSLGSIAPHGASKSFLVRMSTPPDLFFDGTTTLVATATASRTEADAVSADDTDSSSTLVTEQADLRVYKYMLPTSPIVGEVAQYTILVDNYGPSTARDVLIRDTLLTGPADALDSPISIQSCAFSVSQGGGSITQFTCTTGPLVGTQFGTDVGTFRTNRLEPVDFNTAPDGDPVGRLRAAFRLVFNRALTQVNTVTVESPTPDPDWSNNQVETITEVEGTSNISIDKTGPAVAGVGEIISYALTITNTGTGYTHNIVATDYLPAQVGDVVATPSQGSCVAGVPGDSSRPLVCNVGTLGPSATATIDIEVRVLSLPPGGSTMFNDAQVTSSPGDTTNVDNVDSVSTTVHQTCGAKPLAPTLLSPLGGVTSSRYVLFDWADENCATRYKIKVFKNSLATSPIRWAKTTASEIVFRLPKGKTIYWKVKACNKLGCSPFSAPVSFMTPP